MLHALIRPSKLAPVYAPIDARRMLQLLYTQQTKEGLPIIVERSGKVDLQVWQFHPKPNFSFNSVKRIKQGTEYKV